MELKEVILMAQKKPKPNLGLALKAEAALFPQSITAGDSTYG
jgi:hypothetical protein